MPPAGYPLNSQTFNDGTVTVHCYSTVEVDGAIHTGIQRKQTLTLDSFNAHALDNLGNPIVTVGASVQSPGINFKVSTQAQQSALYQELQSDKQQLALFQGSGNQTLISFYTTEINRITQQMISSGYLDPTTGIPIQTQQVMTVDIGDIFADAGIIDVRGSVLQGTGTFDAPGDASVTITNSTPAFLVIHQINIPQTNGGLYFDGVPAEFSPSASDATNPNNIKNLNNNSAGIGSGTPTVNFTPLLLPGTGTPPIISITNTFDPANPPPISASTNYLATDVFPPPNITVVGTIDNNNIQHGISDLGGNVNLVISGGKGNILINAPVQAKNLTIVTGGDVQINGVSTYAVGGEPAAQWQPVTDLTLDQQNAVTSTAVQNQITNVLNTPLGASSTVQIATVDHGVSQANYVVGGVPTGIHYEESISLPFATGGTFTLSFNGHTTGAIAYNVDALHLASALNAMSAGTFTVTGTGTRSDPFMVTKTDDFADYPLMSSNVSNLIGAVSLYGGRISITADYLNVNGIMQSGQQDYNLNLSGTAGSQLLSDIAAAKSSGATGLVLLRSATNFNFTTFFDVGNNQIDVVPVQVNGGYIELHAHIMNSGKGQIQVLGGYGAININNTTNYSLVVEGIDASQRGNGVLLINDTSLGNNYVTLYQAAGNEVTTTVDSGNGSPTSTTQTLTAFNAGTNYTPQSGYRYGWSIAQQQLQDKFATSATSSWAGIISLPDPATVTWDTIENVGQPIITGTGPYYYLDSNAADESVNYTYSFSSKTDTDHVSVYDQHTTSTWYGKKTYYTTIVDESGLTNTNTSTIKADLPIGVMFLGHAQGSVAVTSSNAGIIVDGAIQNPSGTTTLTAATTITQLNPGATVGGQSVVLTAGTGIGSTLTPLNTGLGATPPYDFSTAGVLTLVHTRDTVKVSTGFTGQGTVGSIYQYLGPTGNLDLATQNYTNTGLWALTTGIPFNFSSNQNLTQVLPGDTVQVPAGYSHGGSAGVYQYLAYKGLSSATSVSVATNDTVLVTSDFNGPGGAKGSVYKYTGSAATLNLSTQNYATGPWTLLGAATNIDLGIQDYSTAVWTPSTAVNYNFVDLTTVAPGNTVLVANDFTGPGGTKGSVYQYLASTYTTASGTVTVHPNDTVQFVSGNGTGGTVGNVYQYQPYLFTSDSGTKTLSLSDTVLVAQDFTGPGGTKGHVYQYQPYKFTTASGSVSLATNDQGLVAAGYSHGGTAGTVYKFTGSSGTVNLSTQDYTTSSWSAVTLPALCRDPELHRCHQVGGHQRLDLVEPGNAKLLRGRVEEPWGHGQLVLGGQNYTNAPLWTLVASGSHTFTSDDDKQSLVYGSTVLAVSGTPGVPAGGVYRYQGPAGIFDLGTQTYTNTTLWQLTTAVNFKYTTSAGQINVSPGDAVLLANNFTGSGTPGQVYRYLGQQASLDLGTQNYTVAATWQHLTVASFNFTTAQSSVLMVPGTRVLVGAGYTGGGVPGSVYEYDATGASTLDLTTQNYGVSPWVLVPYTPSLTATTTAGDVVLNQVTGDLFVDHISPGAGNDVTVTSQGGIYVAQGSTGAIGNTTTSGSVTLSAATGGLGTSAKPLVLYSGTAASNSVTATANNGIYLTEGAAGNFQLNKAKSLTGDVVISVPHGSLIDVNPTVVIDQRTYQQLANGPWFDLQLTNEAVVRTGDTIQVAAGYTGGGTVGTIYQFLGQTQTLDVGVQDYSNTTLWHAVASVAPTYTTSTTLAQLQTGDTVQLGAGYAFGGTANAFYQYIGKPTTLNLSAQDYTVASLWQQIPSVPPTTTTDLAGGSARTRVNSTVQSYTNTKNQEYQAYWNFRAQQANAQSIGLVSGQTYYVVVDPNDATKVFLAATHANAVAATPLTLSLTANANGTAQLLYAGTSASANLTVSFGAGTVTRSSGSWLTDGFTAGMEIAVAGTSANTTAAGAYYTIASVTASVLTLTTTSLTLEAAAPVTITGFKPAASGVPFNAATGVSGAELALGAGHGLVTGQAVQYIVPFDPTYTVALTPAEVTYYQNYYAQQGNSAGQITAAITTLQNQRTQEYQDLNTRYGGFGPAFNPHFSYTPSAVELSALTGTIRTWTLSQLLTSLSAGVLKSSANTQFTFEDPNVVGHNATITTGGGVGSLAGQVVIGLQNQPILSTVQKVALAAADRVDVSYLSGLSTSASALVNFQGNAITRIDGGSWLTAGFQAGMNIEVSGASSNAFSIAGQFYKLAAVSAGVLTLSLPAGTHLVTESGKSVSVAPVSEAATADFGIGGTLTRTDGRSWLTGGLFQVGQLVEVDGSSANASTTTGLFYKIASVTPTTLTFAAPLGVVFTGETGASVNVTPVAAAAQVNFSGPANTITSTDGTNWLLSGFQPGMAIQIAGASSNATAPGTSVQIIAVTATTLTISSASQLATETGKSVTLTPVIVNPRTPQSTLGLTFGTSTLTRHDGGSWLQDGFQAGMKIQIAGSAHNDSTGNTISSVTDTVITLTSATLTPSTLPQQTLAITFGTNSLTRTDGGSWLSAGFHAGMQIQLSGSAHNDTTAGQSYTVASVTASALTLSNAPFTAETDPSVTVFVKTASDSQVTVTGPVPAVVAVAVNQVKEITLDTTGVVNITAATFVYINSGFEAGTAENPLNLGQISAGDQVRIKARQGIFNSAAANVPNIVTTNADGSLIVEAGLGAIGTSVKPLDINLAAGATLTARAAQSLYITQHNAAGNAPDLNVETVSSDTGSVNLTADGSILDGLHTDTPKIGGTQHQPGLRRRHRLGLRPAWHPLAAGRLRDGQRRREHLPARDFGLDGGRANQIHDRRRHAPL